LALLSEDNSDESEVEACVFTEVGFLPVVECLEFGAFFDKLVVVVLDKERLTAGDVI
jgi:hypothetical protein